MREKVEAALKQIRPALLADGVDVQLVDVKEGVVTVRLTVTGSGACGGCGGCGMATMTLQYEIEYGIERILKQQVPEVKEVVVI